MGANSISRRGALAGAALLTSGLAACANRLPGPTSAADPFTLGVASGSPEPDGFVLWTRLAPEPLAPGGNGGMTGPTPVSWEIATDEAMSRVVRTGVAVADDRFAYSVHLEVEGLHPDRPYWYRFSALGHRSPVGRARTAPAPGAPLQRLRMVAASCAHWELGFFSAYRHMAAEEPDLVLFLGDYIYEYSNRGARGAENVRRHDREGEALSIADYRNRYALYRTDPDLRALHAAAPCLATWDDHEVQNDYANRWSPDLDVAPETFLKRRAAGYRAFYEHMPLRRSARPRGADMRIHGQTGYGDLASVMLLDGRQYRTIQPCPTPTTRRAHVALQSCADLTDPSRTMLGAAQERWLYDRFRQTRARWTIVAQDLIVADLVQKGPGGIEGAFTDGWGGYQANRERMLTALEASRAPNPVFLAGDIHSFWANDLKTDFRAPESRTIASEFVTSGIAQYGAPQAPFVGIQARNPHVKFVDLKANGYLSIDVAADRMQTRFQAISDRRDPAATVRTLQSFVVEAGRPGVVLA